MIQFWWNQQPAINVIQNMHESERVCTYGLYSMFYAWQHGMVQAERTIDETELQLRIKIILLLSPLSLRAEIKR